MDGLPFLPGNSFRDPTKSNYHVSQTLRYKNGYQVAQAYPKVGIGGDPLRTNQLSEHDLDDLANYQPTLTYGKVKQAPPSHPFVPAYVSFDKKVLRFYGYFKETVQESTIEHYRVHHIKLHYYLEDDTIELIEPPRPNSGTEQILLINRQLIPKNEQGDTYNWKDLNNGINICVYGRVYRLTDCDEFTKHWLTSEGIPVAPPENRPEDPYLYSRRNDNKPTITITPCAFDKRKQFLELDRKVLRFYAIWENRNEYFGECRRFIIHFYLADDTLEVAENHQTNDGHDPFPLLIRRTRMPKDIHDHSPAFPSIYLDLSEHEVKEYFMPKDFKIGETVVILGRRFLIYDCDNFTKAWYYQHFGMTDFTPVKVDFVEPNIPKQTIPEYNKLGSLEDSLGQFFNVIPKPPARDWVKYMENFGKILRYKMELESKRPEDEGRKFVLSYRLYDDMIQIYEVPERNTGHIAGAFLNPSRVAKKGSTCDKPMYYGPTDFYIGARLELMGFKFIINDTDDYAVNWIEAHKDLFAPELVNNLQEKKCAKEEAKSAVGIQIRRKEGDLERILNEIKLQLRRLAVTDRLRIDDMFLKYNRYRNTAVSLDDLAHMLNRMNLPADKDIVQKLMDDFGSDDRLTLKQFRAFFEAL